MIYRLCRYQNKNGFKKLSIDKMLSLSAVFFLWLAAAFDPIGGFGFRYPALIFALAVLVLKATIYKKSIYISLHYKAMFILFVVFIPLYGLAISSARGGLNGKFIDTSYISSALYFICSLLYFDEQLEIEDFLEIAILVLRFLCLLIYACFLTVIFGFSSDWIYSITNRGLMFFGSRQYGGITFPYLYVITSPMLILLIAHDAWNYFEQRSVKKLIFLLASSLALFLSGTRAHIIVSTVGLVFLWLWYRYRSSAIFYSFVLLIVGVVSFSVFRPSVIADMFSPANPSIAAKISYLSAYDKILSDPITLIFGQGYNAHVWSNEFSRIVNYGTASKTELTYIEYVRVFGFIGIFALFIVLYITGKRFATLSWNFLWISPALILYLLVSAINPYLFSSNGMMVLGICAAIGTIDLRRKIVNSTTELKNV